VRRDLIEKDAKRIGQARELGVRGDVVVFDVGDDADFSMQVEKRTVGLVAFGQKPLAFSVSRVAVGVAAFAADHDRRIEAARLQNRRGHRGRRRLAVGPGDRDRATIRHEVREQCAATNEFEVGLPRRDDFRIVLSDRRAHDDRARRAEIFRGMTDKDRSALLGKLRGERRRAVGRAGDANAEHRERHEIAWSRQRDPQDRRAQHDAEGVGERDDHRGAHELG